MGMLLRHIKQRKWDAVGVDPSPSLSKIAREWQGVQVYNCFLNELPASEERSFDVIALSDVFEHIAEPLPFLADVQRFLRDDGIVYVKVPNGAWNLFKQRALAALGKRPARGIWDSYEHVVHYTARDAAEDAGGGRLRGRGDVDRQADPDPEPGTSTSATTISTRRPGRWTGSATSGAAPSTGSRASSAWRASARSARLRRISWPSPASVTVRRDVRRGGLMLQRTTLPQWLSPGASS